VAKARQIEWRTLREEDRGRERELAGANFLCSIGCKSLIKKKNSIKQILPCRGGRDDATEMAPQALGKIDFGDGNGAVRGWQTRMKGLGVAPTGECGSNRSGPALAAKGRPFNRSVPAAGRAALSDRRSRGRFRSPSAHALQTLAWLFSGTPASVSIAANSPDWNISRVMSQPPTNAPLT
jgi:hypothetical protein